MAIEVYLDHSDISQIATAIEERNNALLDIYDRFLEYVESGSVIFRYSCVHVAEICKPYSNRRGVAKIRSEVISSLANQRDFVLPTWIWQHELRSLMKNGHKPSKIKDTGNIWGADTNTIIRNHSAKKVISELGLKEKLSRIERRRNISILTKNNKVRIKKYKSVFYDRDITLQAILKAAPFLRGRMNDDDIIMLAMHPDKSKNIFTQFMRSLSTPDIFFDVFFENMETADNLIGAFLNIENAIYDKLSDAERIRKLRGSQSALQTMADFSPYDLQYYLLEDDLKLNDINKFNNIIEYNIDKYPSIHTVSTLFKEKIKSSCLSRSPQRSDGCDILHAAYFPYVNIFRADNNTRSILERLPLRNKPHLPRSLEATDQLLREIL